jgi:dynactin-5
MAAALSPKQSNQQTLTFPSSDDYIRTTTQNYVSRTAHILNPSNVRIKGKTIIQPDVKIHGDYGAPIQIGRYCFIDNGVVISPTVVNSSSDPTLTPGEGAASASPGAAPSTNEKALQLTIGSSCRIGSNTKVHSLSIGSSVIIGSNCILHPRSKIYDCVVIEDWTVIPPDMIVPPFSRVKGSPGRIVGGLPECCGSEFLEGCARDYGEFVRRLEGKK